MANLFGCRECIPVLFSKPNILDDNCTFYAQMFYVDEFEYHLICFSYNWTFLAQLTYQYKILYGCKINTYPYLSDNVKSSIFYFAYLNRGIMLIYGPNSWKSCELLGF